MDGNMEGGTWLRRSSSYDEVQNHRGSGDGL